MTLNVTPFPEVLRRFRAGEMVILVDDAQRENEGDLTLATEHVTPEQIAFMMREARGLICVTIDRPTAERLQLPLQTVTNSSPFQTPFTVSVDLRAAAAAGVTSAGRAETMRAMLDPAARPDDFTVPGHVFPLVANPAGVLGRQGQTEGSLDLARIAGLKPSGIICEILNEDGTMARAAELNTFAHRHGLAVTTIEEIIRYRVSQEVLVRETARNRTETDFGTFEVVVFENDVDGKEHLALIHGDPANAPEPPLVRIHSECLTGDVFGSRRCDCGGQLELAMRQIVAAPAGVLLYLRQEGRGIGLTNKLRAYSLQDAGHDTVEANLALGLEADARDYVVAARILTGIGVSRIRLLTNNPRKLQQLQQLGITVVERLPVLAPADECSRGYLETKRNRLGHWL